MGFLPTKRLTASAANQSAAGQRSFSFRIEHDRVVLAVATPLPRGCDQIIIDFVRLDAIQRCDERDRDISETRAATWQGWTGGKGWQILVDALNTLKRRHEIRSAKVAVSLSGDYCVTRISTGPTEDVDAELASLGNRIPRYLQLGPGGKVIGHTREQLAPGIDHALTAIGNQARIQALYEAFLTCDINVAWVEPSLVSMARLVGYLGLDRDTPVLIADAFGNSWEAGISHQGRLLLDYRPSAARDAQAFADTIDQHLSRLRRFCLRHRRIDRSDLNQLVVCGDGEKVDVVIEKFRHIDELAAYTICIGDPTLEIEHSEEMDCDMVAAVAAILPLIRPETQQTAPDLLEAIRRERDQTYLRRSMTTWWPAAVASFLLLIGYGFVCNQRQVSATQERKRNFVETQMRETRVRMAQVQSTRDFVSHLKTVDEHTYTPEMAELVDQVAQCLPPGSRLRSLQLDSDHQIHLEGHSNEESDIYEIVGAIRHLPGVNQVALLGTTASVEEDGSQFLIRLGWQAIHSPQASNANEGSHDE